jgi:hypothetical protein
MNKRTQIKGLLVGSLLLVITWLFPVALGAKENAVMGKIEFEAGSRIEKTSGVWIDDQYVGYVHELKGSKSVLLLPGVHNVTVRQDGYQDYAQQVFVEPGKTATVVVAMAKDLNGKYPYLTATLKIEVNPSRAAVFVDGLFVGHVGEFEGIRRGMLIAPGMHKIRIALPGYQTFETDVNALAHQKVEVKTHLLKTDAPLEAPLVQANTTKSSPGTQDTAALAH